MIRNRGRGSLSNETGRFENLKIEIDPTDDDTPLKTRFFKDTSRSIVTENNSPDIPFRYSMNFYRGCEHGCAYCYARPTHEYLGLSAGLDFETKIFVKENAPALLRKFLLSPKWQPEPINISGITDCYQPGERKFQITRQCLQVLAEFKNPVTLITKNALVTRDIDILSSMAKDNLVRVYLSVTSLNPDLARELEPRTSSPKARIEAICTLAQVGIPVGVNIAPVIPGLNDFEIPHILKAAKDAGAANAGYIPLRLPLSVKSVFDQWLTEHRPEAKTKILNAIREIRGGQLSDSQFGSRMTGQGKRADHLQTMFELFSQRYGLNQELKPLSVDKFQRPTDQLALF